MQIVSDEQSHTCTARCVHCAPTIFRDARRIGVVQRTIIETHLLVCRPLATITPDADLPAHCNVSDGIV